MTLESRIEATPDHAELIELRATRRELGEALVRVTEERDRLSRRLVVQQRNDAWAALGRVAGERDEARDEVVRLGRQLEEQIAHAEDEGAKQVAYDIDYMDQLRAENVRLRTIITELGAAEAAEPQEQIEALRPGEAP